jgi:ABC-2 type transport system ATP-binding protein
MIDIQNLKKRYGSEEVLNIAQFTIHQGECFGLVGNNGAGKTTLFQLILDLIRATEGRVTINGQDVKSHEEWKSYVGSYLDEHMLIPYLSPDEYFEMLKKLYGLSDREYDDHMERFAPLFNGEISGTSKYIRDLSKGNVKKTGIASAFMGSPEIIVLDEPFENLDPTSQNRLKNIIAEESEENGTTFLISSHDLIHVTDICDRIVLLEKGIILKDMREDKESMAAALSDYFNR